MSCPIKGGYDAYKKSKKRKSKGRGINSRTRTMRRTIKRSRTKSYKRK